MASSDPNIALREKDDRNALKPTLRAVEYFYRMFLNTLFFLVRMGW